MDTRSILTGTQSAARDTNKVLRNTYMLLAMTLLFSGAVAGLSMAMNLPHPGLIITLISARCRFIATVLQKGTTSPAPLPSRGQTVPKM